MSRWSARPYRWPYPSTRWTSYDGISWDSDYSPQSISLYRSSLRSIMDSESREFKTSPLTPTREDFVLDNNRGQHAELEVREESDQDQMLHPRRGVNSLDSRASGTVDHLWMRAIGWRLSDMRGMGYLAKMGIAAEDFDLKNADTKGLKFVELLPDTCSHLAWSLGANSCKIAYYDERTLPEIELNDAPPVHSTEAKRTRIKLTEWTDGPTTNGRVSNPSLNCVIETNVKASFLNGLQDTLPIPRNDSFTMYSTVRPHPSYSLGKRVQSWVAFSGWPSSEKPAFSRNIPVHPNSCKHHCCQWSVTLLSIEFLRCDEDTHTNNILHREEYQHGLELLVDSGSSTSELPYQTINAVHTSVFHNANPLPPTSSDHRPTYDVPEDFPMDLHRVRLVFQGERGQEDVAVFAPFKHFVCTRDLGMWPHNVEACPWRGIIFAAHRDTPFGVLGLNFFQTMFLSFHIGKGSDEPNHYLRMSPQEEEVEMYQVHYPRSWDSD
ncbi:hypothetical protein GSI_09775 [Ganoderma sinense ZZ0214-1]|uniref:Uncharacterized protein n=1 Tax=Ganoderma sinense ZZ0214-1 TaxID=1077348 RepID=A0A2G8S301_9APHY|nr:hypothetical protein GSI_09775 [Ganoderma sinense ZZ0214-1]